MSQVPRAAPGTTHRGTLSLRKIIIYFQAYPGTDPASGIADVEYVFKLAGKVAAKGKTTKEGRVDLMMLAGVTATLDIFGSTFDITVRNTLEAVTSLEGDQRRLSMLGYELGSVDGILGEKTDRAILNFQADNNLDTDGSIGPKTRHGLTSKVGE